MSGCLPSRHFSEFHHGIPQEGEMVLAPGDNVVEIVAGGDRGAGHQQQDLVSMMALHANQERPRNHDRFVNTKLR
jgi:hypothetical protein